MTGHESLCFEVDPWQQCICDQIARARADERERIAQAIEEYATTMDERWGHVSPVSVVLYNAALIARRGGGERERIARAIEERAGQYFEPEGAGMSDRERVAAVVSAARAWVARIIDPPNLWADEVDFALITAVNAYEDAAAIARGADG